MTIPVPEQRLAAADAAPVAHHRTTRVDGVNIFYRKAGPVDAPAVLLMHGFPTSSHMFRNLIAALANLYHVMAPDYPGYGQSEAPDRSKFAYTFQYTDGVADVSRVSPDNWVHDQALLDRPGMLTSSSISSTTTGLTCRSIPRSKLTSALTGRRP